MHPLFAALGVVDPVVGSRWFCLEVRLPDSGRVLPLHLGADLLAGVASFLGGVTVEAGDYPVVVTVVGRRGSTRLWGVLRVWPRGWRLSSLDGRFLAVPGFLVGEVCTDGLCSRSVA